MNTFDLDTLIVEGNSAHQRYLEFLRVPSLSAGIYRLPAGSADAQNPHTEDEVYYVVSGRGAIRVADETQAVRVGTVVFVQAGVEHRFVNIEEALVLLVFFAPAEYSRRAQAADVE